MKLRGKILDLGCGILPYYSLYRDHFAQTVACDYDIRGPIDVQLDASNLPFSNASFDVILMSEVIEHVPNAEKALAEINRVLKPGGLLLITWPFNYMMHEIPHDYVRYTEFGMERLLDKTGMRIENLFRRGNAFMTALVLTEFFFSGLFELFARILIVGKFFRRLKGLFLSFFFGSLYRFYLMMSWKRAYRSQRLVGEDLKGTIKHMSLWNLGYCARVRKPGDS